MKKKLLLAVLPLLALASCGSNPQAFVPYVDYVDNIPTVHMAPTEHHVYLLLSPYGIITAAGAPVKGVVTEKFYENTVTWVAEAGTDLPVAESTVSGASFRGWAYYNEDNDHVWPDYYTTVPATNGLALKAIFDGTISSSGGGGGGGGTDPSLPSTGYGLLFSDNSYAVGTYTGTNMDDKEEYKCTAVNFTAGLTFQMYDFANSAGWIVDINPYSFGDTSGAGANTSSHVTVAGGKWSVVADFTADVYIQLKMNEDTIYFELA